MNNILDFGFGNNNSRDNFDYGSERYPIIIDKEVGSDFGIYEYAVTSFYCNSRRWTWKIVGRGRFSTEQKIVDEIRFEWLDRRSKNPITEVKSLYFDITKCIDGGNSDNFKSTIDNPSVSPVDLGSYHQFKNAVKSEELDGGFTNPSYYKRY